MNVQPSHRGQHWVRERIGWVQRDTGHSLSLLTQRTSPCCNTQTGYTESNVIQHIPQKKSQNYMTVNHILQHRLRTIGCFCSSSAQWFIYARHFVFYRQYKW